MSAAVSILPRWVILFVAEIESETPMYVYEFEVAMKLLVIWYSCLQVLSKKILYPARSCSLSEKTNQIHIFETLAISRLPFVGRLLKLPHDTKNSFSINKYREARVGCSAWQTNTQRQKKMTQLNCFAPQRVILFYFIAQFIYKVSHSEHSIAQRKSRRKEMTFVRR